MGLIKAPVTALQLYQGQLFAGIGSFLRVYLVQSNTRSFKSAFNVIFDEKILKHSVIHGLKFFTYESRTLVIIFGGRELCICELFRTEKGDELLKAVSTVKTKDWIWDVALIYQENQVPRDIPYGIALALGHNSILLCDWQRENIVTESHCEEKCILYSAHFVKEERPTWSSLTLCSGTVFNQVVIWKPGTFEKVTSTAKVIERIHAHDGVIFSMDFDLNSGLLVTASDDRSICIWSCQSLRKFSNNPLQGTDTSSEDCLCKLYGHESRVWRACCVQYATQLYIISVGEDGYCIFWKLTPYALPNEMKSLEGNIVLKIRCHKGRNIWSFCNSQNDDIIATGGGDGGIRLWNLRDLIDDQVEITRHPFNQVQSELKEEFGSLKSIHMCSQNTVLGHTDAGVLLQFNTQNCVWKVVNRDNNFKSYAIMRVCDDANFVAIGNTKGEVCLLLLDESWDMVCQKMICKATEGKIHNMTWCSYEGISHLFISGPGGEFTCCKFGMENDCDSGSDLSLVQEYSWLLPIAKHRWHMGAVLVKNIGTTYVTCGDRRGSLHLFKEGLPDPVHTLHGVHGENGVTSIRQNGSSIISTGRDGIWRKLKVDFQSGIIKVMTQNRAAQGMDWLEASIAMATNYVGILGFHGRNFTAWSSNTGDTLLTVECGGGHRDWSFKVGKEKSYLAFIKESFLHMARVDHVITKETSVVESHFHGGQITCMKHINSFIDKVSRESITILATGSEDTKVYISAYILSTDASSVSQSKLHHIYLIDDHISSVRSLAICTIAEDDSYSEKVLFTGGGRATINCYIIKIDKQRQWFENCDVEHIATHNLNVKVEKHNYKVQCNANPETRYMDLAAWKSGTAGNKMMLAAACSDAVIRVFSLNLGKRELILNGQTLNHTHCFLTVHRLTMTDATYVVTGATDGFIRIWNMENTETLPVDNEISFKLENPSFEVKVHMSGINAMDIQDMRMRISNYDRLFLLATGGDDNAIHLHVLSVQDMKVHSVMDTCSISNAHSTQITGLKFTGSRTSEHLGLLSTSIDQRVTKWRISFNHGVLSCEFVTSVLTDIADVASLEVWSSENNDVADDTSVQHYAICGQGIQIF